MNPDTHTNREFFLEVGDGHQLYVCDWGNKKARTVFIALHGGPGDSSKDHHKQSFDPSIHRVIFFDQRGCGQSTPTGSLEHNTTDHLVADITKIADHLKLKQFALYGGSWGAGLALLYAIQYPRRVKALVLRSVFTLSRDELDWIEQGKFRRFFPEVWERFLARTPSKQRDNPMAYHYKNILGTNDAVMHRSALAIEELEHTIMNLDDRLHPIDPNSFDPTGARMLAHYFTNNCFLPDKHVLGNASKLTMPVWLVHGRYDMDCPPITAYQLHQKLPHSHLIWAISNHRAEHEMFSILRTILLQFEGK